MHKNSLIVFVFSVLLWACNSSESNQSTSGSVENMNLSAVEFSQKIGSNPDAQIVDVRTQREYKGGHIAKATNIDISSNEFEAMASALDKNKPTFVYCLSGSRSKSAVKYLQSQGFTKVYDLPGGMLEWRRQNLPEDRLLASGPGLSMNDYLAKLKEKPTVLVDFYADWCVPCRKMEPFIRNISEELGDNVLVLRIDVDQNQELAKELGVSALPVIKVYKNQKESWHHMGYADEATLRAQI